MKLYRARSVDPVPTEQPATYAIPRHLDAAVEASLEASALASMSLRAAVADRVHYLRRCGAPPERVIVAIKQATHEALARALHKLSATIGEAAVDDATRLVVGQAVTAAVEAYYG